MLEIVENQQESLGLQVSHQGIEKRAALGVDDPNGPSDGRPHLCGFADRRQGDESDAIVKHLTGLRS
jgi:hypothetical protein